jgi:flagellar biosynthesis anti-sigma factor FlgM
MKGSRKRRQRDSQLLQHPKADPGSEDSVARSSKVEKIRKAVADGSYEVSASAVAGKILDYMLGR